MVPMWSSPKAAVPVMPATPETAQKLVGAPKYFRRPPFPGPSADLTLMVQVTSDIYAGSLGYMAPEVMMGDTYDKRCDVYSFAGLLYEITHRFVQSCVQARSDLSVHPQLTDQC